MQSMQSYIVMYLPPKSAKSPSGQVCKHSERFQSKLGSCDDLGNSQKPGARGLRIMYSYGFLWIMDHWQFQTFCWKSGTRSNKTSAPTLPKAYTPRLKISNIESASSSFVCCVSIRVSVSTLKNSGKP